MTGLLQECRYAVRGLAKSPGFTTAAVLALALGIGANAAVFSLVNALYLKTLPVSEPARLVRITGEEWFSTRVWEHVRDHQPVFEGVAAIGNDRFNVARGGIARYATTLIVSGRFFHVVGAAPSLGRALTSADDTPGARPVVVISRPFWQQELGANPGVLGDTIWLEGQPFEIVGVMPDGFAGVEVGRHVDAIVPMASLAIMPGRAFLLQPTAVFWKMFARLHPGQEAAAATAALRAWQPALADATRPAPGMPGADPSRHLATALGVASAATGFSELRTQFGSAIILLFGVVAAVLLVACATLAALVLARFIDRAHELGVRRALGASGWDLARALLIENVLIVCAGAVLGAIVAVWATRYVIPHLTVPDYRHVAPFLDISADWRVFGVTSALALTAALLTGLLPAIQASRLAPALGFAPATRTSTRSRGAAQAMRVLLTGQVAVSLVLLATAALLVRSFVALSMQNAGFEHERVAIVTVSGNLGPNRNAQMQTVDAIRRRLQALPGVEAAAASLVTPISGQNAIISVSVPGMASTGAADVRHLANRVSPGYFRAYGTPLVTGRDFDERDTPDVQPVAIVNRAFADRYFGGGNPVGRTIILNKRATTVVGMAANAKQSSLRDAVPPFVYAPLSQWNVSRFFEVRFALRTSTPVAASAVAGTLGQIDPQLNLEIRRFAEDVQGSVNIERLLAWCGGVFALLAVAIGAIGTYGVFAYGVSKRRREIGVRMALGATPGTIGGMILSEALVVTGAGAVLGLGGSWMAGRLVEGFLFELSGRDPWMLAAATAATLAVAAGAAGLPARRAAQFDPSSTLREE